MTAQIYYVTLKEPPQKGSLQETVLYRYILQEKYRHTEEIKLLVESALLSRVSERSTEQIEAQWKRYYDSTFPWAEKYQEKEKEDVKKVLQEMAEEGPFRVMPLLPSRGDPTKLKPLKSLLAQRTHDTAPKPSFRELGAAMPQLQQSSGSRAQRRR